MEEQKELKEWQETFSLADWLRTDQAPCEGGLASYICEEYCQDGNCPFWQYLQKAMA